MISRSVRVRTYFLGQLVLNGSGDGQPGVAESIRSIRSALQRHGLIPMDEDTAENNVVQVGRGDRTPPNQHHPEPPFGLPSFLWSPFRSGHTQLREERRQQLTSRGSPISPSRFRHSGHTP
uniref:Ras-associating domain-containing protein n=1 Tax=Ascaris lumbricoides TaxID=6252 RepID=A0A0M3IG06_ASCLU